jgi:hypothetical protein
MAKKLRVVILKPSKYSPDGSVERFRWGFMPNSTLPYMRSMTPSTLGDVDVEIHTVDEYVHIDLDYLRLLEPTPDGPTLLALVGVQSHQLHRALDLAAYARSRGCLAVIGGPHPMTCDTTMLQGRGISFAIAEADLIWHQILADAAGGELRDVYGHTRWRQELESPVTVPPTQRDMSRYVVRMLGLYPARGCPFSCNFCSVIKIAGRRIRSQAVETTIASLKAAKAAGITTIMFTSDNFNKYPEAPQLLNAMIEEKLDMSFFVQCDTQIAKQEEFVALLSRAGCFHMFVGAESFNRAILKAAGKQQNHPGMYADIVRLCNKYTIYAHFSNIIGFPQDDRQGIREHMETLAELCPPVASFYILTPIPGTEQYGDFLKEGRITERNMDRFDAANLVWEHDNLSAKEMPDLLFDCYRRFYSFDHWRRSVRNIEQHPKRRGMEGFYQSVSTIFQRYCAMRRSHPMSGGIRRVARDSDRDYRELRQKTFDFDYAPLPQNLELTAVDDAFNRNLNVAHAGGLHAGNGAHANGHAPTPLPLSDRELVPLG